MQLYGRVTEILAFLKKKDSRRYHLSCFLYSFFTSASVLFSPHIRSPSRLLSCGASLWRAMLREMAVRKTGKRHVAEITCEVPTRLLSPLRVPAIACWWLVVLLANLLWGIRSNPLWVFSTDLNNRSVFIFTINKVIYKWRQSEWRQIPKQTGRWRGGTPEWSPARTGSPSELSWADRQNAEEKTERNQRIQIPSRNQKSRRGDANVWAKRTFSRVAFSFIS